jgi:ribonuclease T2
MLGLLLGSASAQHRGPDIPGRFDYYVLALSWSPTFCESATGAARGQQCGPRPFAFVVHGLWPQYEHGFPEACQVPAPRLPREIMRSMLDLMPAPALVFHEWDQHGTCSGLPPGDYFDLVRSARGKIRIPQEYSDPSTALSVSPAQVVDAFVRANPGLSPGGITVDCNRTRLREVRICLSRDLQFRECSPSARAVCRSERLIMPPVRGG